MLGLSPIWRVYLQMIITVPPYCFTIAPLQYEIKSLICEVFYKSHAPDVAGCELPEVHAQTAAAIAAVAMLALITTALGVIFGTLCAKKYGLKATTAYCVLSSTSLNLFYIAAVHYRGELGLALIFLAQLTIMLGGVGGAQYCVTTIISVLAEEGKTSSALGMLAGLNTLVIAACSVVAGYIYDWHHQAPFVISAIWLVVSAFATLFLVPYIPIAPTPGGSSPLDLLRIFAPRNIVRAGKEQRDWSLTFVALGAGLSMIATSNTSSEVGILGMNSFGVTPPELGALGAWTSLSKGLFLILFFPRLSKAAFKYLDNKAKSGEQRRLLEDEEEERKPSADLYFLFAAIVLEMAAVIGLTFAKEKWHLFALSTFIPAGAGAGALVNALIVHFVPKEKKPEAVGASQLLIQCSAITAIVIFGYLFAWLSNLELGNLVFLANGFVGGLALLALLFVR